MALIVPPCPHAVRQLDQVTQLRLRGLRRNAIVQHIALVVIFVAITLAVVRIADDWRVTLVAWTLEFLSFKLAYRLTLKPYWQVVYAELIGAGLDIDRCYHPSALD